MMLRLACAGSLPAMGDPLRYPFSHIEFWLKKQLGLQYSIVGTGEPGWRNRHGMVERFTQDMEGVEIKLKGAWAKSYCSGRIKPALRPGGAREVAENKYLASIVPGGVLKKAAITDPVTIGIELIANSPMLVRTYPEIFEDVTDALRPVVGAVSDYVDIVQFDCPSHVARPIREPWRYVNELSKTIRKRTWIHIDGDVARVLPALIKEYDVDVLNVNLFGREEEANFKAIAESRRMVQDEGKKLAPAVVNTQISDEIEEVESIESIYSRMGRLSRHLSLDTLEAVTPGCGLRLLQNTAQTILERLPAAVQKV